MRIELIVEQYIKDPQNLTALLDRKKRDNFDVIVSDKVDLIKSKKKKCIIASKRHLQTAN
jgi:hypothetical protein